MGLLNLLPNCKNVNWPWNSEVSSETYLNIGIQFPPITIVTPSFNQGQFIEETIRSILLQNYPNLEYIVIDGGSTDNTLDVLEKYKQWINVIVSEKDEGQSDALIKGFKRSSGKFLNWINSDDILCPYALFHIGKTFAENPELNFVYGKNGIMNINSILYNYMPHPKDLLKIRYLYEMPYGQQACFFSRELYFQAGGINRDLQFSMDYELYLRMHLIGVKAERIDDLIGNIRIHHNTKTAQLESIMHQENGNAFMTFLRSSGQHKYADFFKRIGHIEYETYNINIKINNYVYKSAMLLYLKKNVWYYYNLGQYSVASKMVLQIIKISPVNIFNKNYLKIIYDRKRQILQPSRSR